ncbi:MAG TPA: glycerophosphodiester phosphodiesterase [Acidimicrobiia bacterium]
MIPSHWAPPIAIAHRGSRELWPENTMEAFSQAVALGFRFLETDLHVTADGVLVCIHDDTVDRTTEGTGPVSGFRFEELAGLDAGFRHNAAGGYPFRGAGVSVPSLEEAVTRLPDASFVVDLKGEGQVDLLAALIERLSLHDRLIVGSFSDQRLDEFRSATGGRVATSSGPMLSRMWLLTSRVGRGAGGQASALQLPTQVRGIKVVDKRLVDTAHNNGLQVHVWTVNDPAEMESYLDMGVDGIISDRPDLLRDLLISRGQWQH